MPEMFWAQALRPYGNSGNKSGFGATYTPLIFFYTLVFVDGFGTSEKHQ
jgi:hypothetical protein